MNNEKQTEIIDSLGFTYLSEFMEDLPDNAFLNKITTGCGMTSLALTTNRKYVICVPFVALVKNKLIWCKEKSINAIGIYDRSLGGSTEEDLKKFQGDKIITTWDSLNKVVNVLGENISNWKILVDEAHKLVDSGSFRTEAIDNVLYLYKKFGSFVFGTATPIRDKYQLPVLKDIKKINIKWHHLEPVTVNYTKYIKDIHKVGAVICVDFLSGIQKGNAHIFINSVKSIGKIVKIVKSAGFDNPEDIKIVCSQSQRNADVIKFELGAKYTIETVDDPVKKINFYTSTCFEGCDIDDVDGRSFIISDGNRDYTKIDIITTLPQIIGRNRTTKYINTIELLYSPNKYYSNTTEEEYEQFVKEQIKEAELVVDSFDTYPLMVKNSIMNDCETNNFLISKNGKPVVNSTVWYSEMNAFSTLHNLYYVNKKERNKKDNDNVKIINDIKYEYKASEQISIEGSKKLSLGRKTDFSSLCIEYINYVKEYKYGIHPIANQIENAYPIIKEAYYTLGEIKMKALKYRQIEIQRELLLVSTVKSNDYKIVKLLNYRVGEWIPLNKIKNSLKGIYSTLNVKKTAKATDINSYYVTKEESKKIDGKTVKGLTIILNKIK
jgi:hypothetical protein